MTLIAFVAALACQVAAPPTPSPQTPQTPPTPPAAAPATPSVADLFRERNAREAAERAAKAEAERPRAVPDGTYHCRRTDTGLVCGNNEEAMQRTEAEAKAQLERMLNPPD